MGGGHYYAYIRPTAAHFADSQSHNCDPSAVTSSQWFKFDDEHVSIASEHEAVEGNFGRRKASPFPADLLSEESSNEIGGGIDSVSSAYMLVYVRDKDVPEIMRPVVEEDIPPSMAAVVNSELLRRQTAIRAREHEKAMTSVRIYTESAVRAWCRPSAYQDFLVETDFVSLRALKADCGLLGLIFLIATAFEVLPHRVLLFTIGERVPLASKPVHGGSNISVSDEEIESTRLDYLHDVWNNRDLSIMKFITQDHRFYIHVRDPLESPSLENDIRQEYLRLMDRECELLQQMRLLSGNDLTCGDFDWFEGCGIGRGLELCRRMLPSGDASNELIKHLIVMNESALALARRAPRLHSCDRLIFFRAYDPHRELRLPLEVVDSAFPIKYLFSKIVNLRRGRYRVLYNTIRRFLEANNYYPSENQVRDKWVDADLWLSSTPVTWRQIVDDEGVDSDDNRGNKRGEADEEIDSDDEIEHGDFLYVDGTTLGEVYSCFEWARFEIKKRTFALRPYSPKDGQLLQALTDADDSIPTLDVLSGMRVDIVAAEAAKVLGVPNLASNIMLYSLEGSSNSLWLDPATQLRDAETAVERMSNILLFRVTPFPGSGGFIKGRRRLEFILADGATRQRYRAVLERESQAAIIDGKRRKTLSGQRDIENASLPFSEIYNEALLLKVCDEIDFGLVLEHVNERLEYKMFDDESKGCMLLLYSGSANCHIEHTRLCPPILDDIPLLSDIPYSW